MIASFERDLSRATLHQGQNPHQLLSGKEGLFSVLWTLLRLRDHNSFGFVWASSSTLGMFLRGRPVAQLRPGLVRHPGQSSLTPSGLPLSIGSPGQSSSPTPSPCSEPGSPPNLGRSLRRSHSYDSVVSHVRVSDQHEKISHGS